MASGKLVAALEGFYSVLFTAVFVLSSENVNKQMEALDTKEEGINNAFSDYENVRTGIYTDLQTEFVLDLNRWNAEIDKDDLSVRFFIDEKESPKVMFLSGSPTLSEYYTELIRDFCPRYYSVLKKRISSSLITEIKIEGHTSSEWLKNSTDSESYFANLSLSQERAKNVMMICLASIEPLNDPLFVPFRKKATANGVAFSKPILNADLNENAGASRRVEFKVVTSFDDQISKINLGR